MKLEAGKKYLDGQGREYLIGNSGPDFYQDGKGRLWWRDSGKCFNRSPEWDLVAERLGGGASPEPSKAKNDRNDG